MKIEIHIIAYNEKVMLPFTVAHYKKMFADPIIIVHDNNSSDGTADIARSLGCTVIPFSTDGMNDMIQSEIKSKAVKDATSDWVLCIDSDELCYIDNADIEELEKRNVNIVQFEGWNIFDEVESPWKITLIKGRQEDGYSKPVLVKVGEFSNVVFGAGAHRLESIVPIEGKVAQWSKSEFKLLHFKHWSCHYNIVRSAELGSRQSEENRRRGHSTHFSLPATIHTNYFNQAMEQRIEITDKHIVYEG